MFTGGVLQGTQPKLIGPAAQNYAHLDPIVDRMVRQSPTERPSISEVIAELARYSRMPVVDQAPRTVVKTEAPISGLPPTADVAGKLELLRRDGTQIKIYPIIPTRCAEDEFRVNDVGPDTVQFDKPGSGHRITVPKSRIKEVLPMDPNGKSATVVVEGRLQWVSLRQSWKFFLEAPPAAANLQIGFGRPSSALDQRRIDVESMLKSRGTSVWLVDERYVPGAISEGRQVVYDEDGKYFRVPSGPNHLILVASGP